MSMYRQLWLAIVLSSILALTGALVASAINAQAYLEQQLSLKNADNASALALSISQSEPSKVSAEVAMAAMFDSGHYESINILAPDGSVMLSRRVNQVKIQHPWLEKWVPIRGLAGEAEISDGWKQFGTVVVVSHASFAYDALWKTLLGLASTMLLAGAVSCLLGFFVLRRIKAPLKAVVNQARGISNQRFFTIAEPNVPELKQLAKAMNKTVLRLKEIFEAEAQKLEVLRKEACSDPLTGISNRSYFMSNLRATLNDENTNGGNLILVRIANLAEVNKQLGRQDCDALLRCIAECLDSYAVGDEHAIAARLNGSDFALMTMHTDKSQVLAKAVLNNLRQITYRWLKPDQIIFVGMANFKQGLDMSNLLAEADNSLAEAERNGGVSLREMTNKADINTPQSLAKWAELISDALHHNRTRLASFPVVDNHGVLIHDECPLRLQLQTDGEWEPAGRFIAVAERLEITADLDLAAIKLGIEQLSVNPHIPALAINLSANSIKQHHFCRSLFTLLKKHAALAPRLWLEINAEQAFIHFTEFKAFCLMLKDTKVMLGIEHFGHQFAKMGMLYELGLDYIKVDATFINDVDQNTGNQIFLHGLTDIAHNIGIKVIAEGISNEAERAMVLSLGFDGVTGSGVKV